jgi:hypothetical protein
MRYHEKAKKDHSYNLFLIQIKTEKNQKPTKEAVKEVWLNAEKSITI